jgi:hypothetical protein
MKAYFQVWQWSSLLTRQWLKSWQRFADAAMPGRATVGCCLPLIAAGPA